jgi:hypothetical protein
MNAVLVALGLVLLVGLSMAIGVVVAGERHARERRRLAAVRWHLWRWEQELLSTADVDGCASCVLLRRRAELHRSATDLLRD